MDKEFLRKRKVEILRQAKMGHFCACVKCLYASRCMFSYVDFCKLFTRCMDELFSKVDCHRLFDILHRGLSCELYDWLNNNYFNYYNIKYSYYGSR